MPPGVWQVGGVRFHGPSFNRTWQPGLSQGPPQLNEFCSIVRPIHGLILSWKDFPVRMFDRVPLTGCQSPFGLEA